MTNPVKNKSLQRQEMLSDNQGNEIVIEVETVPSGVRNHLASSQIFLRKSSANSTLSTFSQSAAADAADREIFSHGNDRRHNRLLRFSSLNESISQIYHGPEGVDEACTFHETVQGIECSRKVRNIGLMLSTGCCCMCVYVCMWEGHVCVHVCALNIVYVWRSENSLVKSIPPTHTFP